MDNKPFSHKLVIIGYGSIGQAILPVIIKEFSIDPHKIHIITALKERTALTESLDIKITDVALTPTNYEKYLRPHLSTSDILLNLSVDVSSVALIHLCQEIGVIYLDTCIEPWKGYYTDPSLSIAERSNYALREQAIKLKKDYPHGTTSIIACGANPGIISQLTKQAILNLAKDLNVEHNIPKTQVEWASLAYKLEIKTIHIAEYDWQTTSLTKPYGDFHNTWSCEGFISEGLQPAELGWGTHEKSLPHNGHEHTSGQKSSIYLNTPGFSTRVRSWTPLAGPYQGHLVTHNEAISISSFLTLSKDAKIIYRPTVHYAYRPFNNAVLSMLEMEGRNMLPPKNVHIVKDNIHGIDELGVLLMGHKKQSYWFGSHLSSEEARKIAPYNNATSLQVVSGIISALHWAIKNPTASIVEAEDMNHTEILEKAMPYLGKVSGFYSDWTPLTHRSKLFNESIDMESPWQFKNFIIK